MSAVRIQQVLKLLRVSWSMNNLQKNAKIFNLENFRLYGMSRLWLQAAKKKENMITELRAQVVERENKIAEANKRQKMAEEEAEKLRQDVREMEGVNQSNQEEMAALHEQLTQVSMCVCFGGGGGGGKGRESEEER